MPKSRPTTLFLLLAFATTIQAAGAPVAPRPDAAPPRGRLSLVARLRGEDATQAGLADSRAFTLRTALGFTTAPFDGFQGMVEVENTTSLGEADDYNAAGTNPGGAGRTVIADPAGTGVNQAWLSYTGAGGMLRAGRQRLVLDNARLVGDSGWRQNQQTFDAAVVTLAPAPKLDVLYGYLWRVNRVFGNKSPQRDFTGGVHLASASYSGWAAGRFTAYACLLDLENSAANSSATFGASFAGTTPVTKDLKVTYRAEFATQRDAGLNPVSYRASYHLLELGGATKAFAFNAGHEVLGSDAGLKGFATPLATLHAFNGWADVFLNTPARGLRDTYVSATANLPAGFPLRIVWHDFTSDAGQLAYGREWDAQLTHKFGRKWTGLAKFARFSGRAPFADVTRFWLQCEFTL